MSSLIYSDIIGRLIDRWIPYAKISKEGFFPINFYKESI